ncbi:MAG: hypothetical protein WC494_03850 [Candidatus Pacearchaeota archaeon]
MIEHNENYISEPGKKVLLDIRISPDQRAYIEGVRSWLEESMNHKERILEGIC